MFVWETGDPLEVQQLIPGVKSGAKGHVAEHIAPWFVESGFTTNAYDPWQLVKKRTKVDKGTMLLWRFPTKQMAVMFKLRWGGK